MVRQNRHDFSQLHHAFAGRDTDSRASHFAALRQVAHWNVLNMNMDDPIRDRLEHLRRIVPCEKRVTSVEVDTQRSRLKTAQQLFQIRRAGGEGVVQLDRKSYAPQLGMDDNLLNAETH